MHIAPLARHVLLPLLLVFGLPASANTASPAATPLHPADWCKRLVVRLPGVSNAMCQQSELLPTGVNSLQGFPLLARQIPAKKAKRSQPPLRVLLMGGIHGDELTSVSVVFRWLQWMPTAAAQQFEWSVVPVVNPDGLLAPKAKRVNANGVDSVSYTHLTLPTTPYV